MAVGLPPSIAPVFDRVAVTAIDEPLAADWVCAVVADDSAAIERARRWLVRQREQNTLCLLVASTAACARLSAQVDAYCDDVAVGPDFFAALEGTAYLLAESGTVCVEPEDIRYALADGGRTVAASVECPDCEDVDACIGALFASLARRGCRPQQARRAVVSILGTDVGSADFGCIQSALLDWMHPDGTPVVGVRAGCARSRLWHIRALVPLLPQD
ncbi:hypothetical protein CAI21_12680 [Alkalilimnicola ehrlichii]|nr:hypothetical protein CAI21_12680 [Alkalilimnicola ehrlichii]